jgi:hypothetical protein
MSECVWVRACMCAWVVDAVHALCGLGGGGSVRTLVAGGLRGKGCGRTVSARR